MSVKRLIILLFVLAVLSLLLVLGLSSSNKRPEQEEKIDLSKYLTGIEAKESPMLAALVEQGKLPPLEERLPDEPIVVKPYERPGIYGGTWHMIHDGPDLAFLKITLGYAPLLRWKADSSGVEPGLAKSYEYSDGGRTLTLHLRKGLKWSDGHPYTSADFKFWYELCEDERYKLQPPGWSYVNGKPMKVEAPDPYTIVMRFAGPNYFAHLQLATGFWNPEEYSIPKHYMIQFHPDYNKRYKDFVTFERKNITHLNPDRPTMWSWKLKSIEASGTRVIFERNPYCPMVDTYGRQLPYIDRVQSTLVLDSQLKVLRMLAGEVDCQWRMIELTDLGLFMRGQKRGGYHIKLWNEGSGAKSAVAINWDQRDPVLRKIVRDKRFRQALAYAVPRDKINKVIFRGMARPQNSVISPQSWHFKHPEGKELYEKWRNLYSEYDLKKANLLLDEMGLKRNKSGIRLRPDGKPLQLIFTVVAATSAVPFENDEALMISEEWRKLGIKVLINTPPGPEISNRIRLAKYDVTMLGQSEMDLFTYPEWVFPTGITYWHPLTGKWYQTAGKEGWAPEGPAKDLIDIYEKIKSEPDLDKCHRLIWEAVRIHMEEGPFCLGTVGDTPSAVIIKNNFHNVPDTGVTGPWAVAQPAASYPEQFFIDPGGAK